MFHVSRAVDHPNTLGVPVTEPAGPVRKDIAPFTRSAGSGSPVQANPRFSTDGASFEPVDHGASVTLGRTPLMIGRFLHAGWVTVDGQSRWCDVFHHGGDANREVVEETRSFRFHALFWGSVQLKPSEARKSGSQE